MLVLWQALSTWLGVTTLFTPRGGPSRRWWKGSSSCQHPLSLCLTPGPVDSISRLSKVLRLIQRVTLRQLCYRLGLLNLHQGLRQVSAGARLRTACV